MAGMTTENFTGIVRGTPSPAAPAADDDDDDDEYLPSLLSPTVQTMDHKPLPGTWRTSVSTIVPVVGEARLGRCTLPLLHASVRATT